MSPSRRQILKAGLGLGAAGTGLAAYWRLWPPGPSALLEPVDVLAQRFFEGLDDEQRSDCCVPYDHPLRQVHNRGVWGAGRSVFTGFGRSQRALLCDLWYAGLSPAGRRRVPREYFTRWPGVHSLRVLVCGDPTAPPYQVILTGAHVNLRIGGRNREGVAFGGPQVYGDQRGDGQVGLPGNLYRDQFLLAQRLLRGLDEGRRRIATLTEAPPQTWIEVRGSSSALPGIPVRELEPGAQALAGEIVETILSTWPAQDVAYARECLVANGGIPALSFSTYEHGAEGPIPEAQVFRLEGPAAVFHFRGHPHVHAFVNVAMDGESPLSVGERVGDNPEALEGPAVQALFERVLRERTGADLAYYPRESVAGGLRAGPIRSGDVFVLESWQDHTVVGTQPGSRLLAPLRERLRAQGRELESGRDYRIATTGYAVGEGLLGVLDAPSRGARLRDLAVEHLRERGFPPA
jgi:hypothetical protein